MTKREWNTKWRVILQDWRQSDWIQVASAKENAHGYDIYSHFYSIDETYITVGKWSSSPWKERVKLNRKHVLWIRYVPYREMMRYGQP